MGHSAGGRQIDRNRDNRSSWQNWHFINPPVQSTASATDPAPQQAATTQISWKSAVNGNWSTATRWSGSAVPTAADAVTISIAGTYTVTIDSAAQARALSLTNATATLNLITGGALSIGTTFSVTAGNLSLSGGAALTGGTLSLGAAAGLTTKGTATITSAVALSGTTSIGAGVLQLSGGGSLDGAISGAGTLSLTGGVLAAKPASIAGLTNLAITNNAALAVSGTTGTLAANVSLYGYGALALSTGANLQATGTLSFGSGGVWGAMNGAGTLTTRGTTAFAENGSGASALIGQGMRWVNAGQVQLNGLAYLNSVASDSVTIVNQASGIFNLTSDHSSLLSYQSGTDSFSNAGTIAKAAGSGTSTLQVMLSNTGVINIATGTLSLLAGGTLGGTIMGPGSLNLGGGSFTANNTALNGAAAISVTGGAGLTLSGTGKLGAALAVSAYGGLVVASGTAASIIGKLSFGAGGLYGTMRGPGTLTTTGSTTVIDNASSASLLAGGGLSWVNGGTVASGGVIYVNSQPGDSVAILNQAGARFNLNGDHAQLLTYYGGTDLFTNAGTLSKTSGTGQSAVGIAVNSTGVINIASGTLALSAGGTLGGSITGTGLLSLAGGNFTATNAALNGAASILVTGGAALSLSATGKLSTTTAVAAYGGLVAGTGVSASIAGSLSFGAGGLYGTMQGAGTLTTTGTTTVIDNASSASLLAGHGLSWVNGGTVAANGVIYVNSQPGDSVSILNQAGAKFNLNGDHAQLLIYYGGTDLFTNAGTISKTSGTGQSAIGIAVNSTGVINIASGTLALSAGGTLGGSITGTGLLALTGGTFSASAGALNGANAILVTSGAELALPGTGTLATALSVTGAGTVSAAAGISATISGALSFGAASTYGNMAGPGTITTAGTTTISNNGAGASLLAGNGLTWVNSGTVIDNGLIYVNSRPGDTVSIQNKAGAVFTLASDSAAILNYYGGTDSFSNAGTLIKTLGQMTSVIGIAITNSGLIKAASGTLSLTSTLTSTGKMQAANGAVLNLAQSQLSNLAGGKLTGGSFEADAKSIIQFANNASITTLSANLILSGAGSAVQWLDTASNTQISLDSKLSSISAAGALTLQSGRAFTATAAGGSFTVAGNLLLQSTNFTAAKLTISATGTAGGAGALTGPIIDNGMLSASGGTLLVKSSLTGTGMLRADAGATLALTQGGALAQSAAGAGTLLLSGATAYSLSGGTLGIANITLAAGGVFGGNGLLAGSLADNGAITATGGTLALAGGLTGGATALLTIAAGATADIAGGNFAGAIGGAGTLRLSGTGTFTLASSGTLAAAAVQIGTGASLGLNAATSLSGSISGPGTLLLGGNAAYTISSGTSLSLGAMVIGAGSSAGGAGVVQGAVQNAGGLLASGGTLLLAGALSGAGSAAIAAGATLDLGGGGSIAGTLGGAGTLRIDAALGLTSGAAITASHVVQTANLTLGASTSLKLAATADYHLTAAKGAAVAITGASGDKLTNAGTLLADGAGAASLALAVINTGTIAISAGRLSFLGSTVNNGIIHAGSGAASFKSTVSGTGTLEVGAGATITLQNGALAAQTIDMQGSASLLNLGGVAKFAATIADFSAGDTIDLLNTTATGLSFDAGVLSVMNGTSLIASLHLSGSYSTASFAFGSDGHGGTAITLV